MNVKNKEIYSEVYQVLNMLGNEYIDKLPISLINMLREKREVNYNPEYTDEIPLNEQNIKKETMAIIVLLYLNYWCEDENEKSEVKHILKNNEEKYQLELRKKYNPDSIFKNYNKESKQVNNKIIDETAIIPYKKSLFMKIINRLRSFFHIK